MQRAGDLHARALPQGQPARLADDEQGRGQPDRFALLDPAGGRAEVVEVDPGGRVDLAQPIFSDLTDELLGVVFIDEKIRIAWRDKRYAADWRWLAERLAGKQISAGSRTRDETRWLINASNDTEPGETYLFDRRRRRLVAQYRIREQLRRDWLAKVEPIR